MSKKEYTDFIILNYIYQRAITTIDVDNSIIFTGDGHFSSTVAFLKNQCGKKVGIYGVKRSCNTQPKDLASWWVALPDDSEALHETCQIII